jgi:Ca2+-binding RTX toxin-like protein
LDSKTIRRLRRAAVAGALGALALGGLANRPATSSAAAHTCFGKRPTIVSGAPRIVGKRASDTIVVLGGGSHLVLGMGGSDRICAGPGKDRIDGGRGSDRIMGGGGADRIDGERGSDRLSGGAGDDTIVSAKGGDRIDGGPGEDSAHSGQGSDTIAGGGGDDRLLGEKGNDRIDGGPGEDLVEGQLGDDPMLTGGPGVDRVLAGPGTDRADGGAGDGDVVSGDAGTDTVSGGPGADDIVSFASATRSGVTVNLAAGTEDGDGHDRLSGIEDAVGSALPDVIVGDGGANRIDGGIGDDTLQGGGGSDEAFGGPGDDKCTGFKVENSCGPERGPPPGSSVVALEKGLAGSSLVIQGRDGLDDLHVSAASGGWMVANMGVRVAPGNNCANPQGNPDAAFCPGEPGLSLIVIGSGGGNDDVLIDPNVPPSVTVKMTGNGGNDTLIGGEGPDVIEAGEPRNGADSGNDRLIGNGGSDTLYADPGADQLFGGKGSDLLIEAIVGCQGNLFNGGGGQDTVNYDRVHGAGVRVALGGTGGPAGCATPDRIVSDESIEGSDQGDVLIGDSGPNGFLGHLGADVFVGKGGGDYVDASDGRRDKRIDCGAGRDEMVRDPIDPRGIGC